uniref:NADH dehydrogenase subunit 3 n=1 Tax=Nephotettix nigropictus TaxID=1563985 RepID=UPI0021D52EC0|nr:NADH dehydrogenase subunit 3 [Nephotettix nigropictus]UXD78684.1 NADH dehydrogenase subunit 3 [Nephotettix nigropictus]
MNMMINWFLVISILMLIISLLIFFISKKVNLDTQKSTPFECGFNPLSYARMPFSTHFFMIAVIFLIFDIEIMLIMPMVITFKMMKIWFWILTCSMFTFILLIGIFHEWMNGMINWTK